MWWTIWGLSIDMANPGYMHSLSLFDYNIDDVIAARDSPIYFSDITGYRYVRPDSEECKPLSWRALHFRHSPCVTGSRSAVARFFRVQSGDTNGNLKTRRTRKIDAQRF